MKRTATVDDHIAALWLRLTRKCSNIAIYGAGKHTEWLLRILQHKGLVLPGIVWDDMPAAAEIGGISVAKTPNVFPPGLDAVVLGTDTFQDRMRARLAGIKGAKPVVVDLYAGGIRPRFSSRFDPTKIHARPENLFIEVTTACNLKCKMCPRDKMTRPHGTMDMPLFKTSIDQAVKMGIPCVSLYVLGEPLVNRHIVEMIAYAKQAGVPRLTLTTNGVLLTAQLARDIINAGLDEIVFSISGATESVYREHQGYKSRHSLVQVEKQTRAFIRERNRAGVSYPHISVQYIAGGDMRDIARYMAKWRNLADDVRISWLNTVGGSKGTDINRTGIHPCCFPNYMLAILANGDVTVCCDDYDGSLVLGNVRKTTLKKCWAGTRLREIRRAHRTGRRDRLPPMCRNCDSIVDGVAHGEIVDGFLERMAAVETARKALRSGRPIVVEGTNAHSILMLLDKEFAGSALAVVGSGRKSGRLKGVPVVTDKDRRRLPYAQCTVVISDPFGFPAETGNRNQYLEGTEVIKLSDQIAALKRRFNKLVENYT